MSTTSQPPQKNPAAGVGKSLQRLFMKGHVSLYRLTGGKVGGGETLARPHDHRPQERCRTRYAPFFLP